MERYRRIRRYGVDDKFIITFQNENGENFFVNKKFKFVPITNDTSCEEIKANAKLYSNQGVKMICTKLWNNRSLKIRISSYFTIKRLEETYRIYKGFDIRWH